MPRSSIAPLPPHERAFIDGYDARAFPAVAVTVDLVVFTIIDERLQVLLVTRGAPPYEGYLALPGGFIRPEEDLDHAASRELLEETGMRRVSGHLEQLGAFGDPDRDPRMRVVTIAYLALLASDETPVAGTDAADASFVPVERAIAKRSSSSHRLAFDHADIIRSGLERARAKLEYTSLATTLCAEPFTMRDLRRVYEIVWGVELDAANFRRKVLGTDDFVRPVGRKEQGIGRPAELYRAGAAARLHPPILRPSRGTRA